MREIFKKTLPIFLGILLFVTPVFAQNPIESLIENLKAVGFQLVLLWLLTLAVVYGVLSHVEIPKSVSARGVISIVSAFMVLLAAAGTQAAMFISNLITASILVAFGLIIAMIFLEITGTKVGGEHIFAKYPQFFGAAILILLIAIFVGLGGLNLVHIPMVTLSGSILAILLFLAVMVITIWALVRETGQA